MDCINEFIKSIEEAKHLALMEYINANTVLLNPKYVKVNPFTFVSGMNETTSVPAMICGLDMHFVVDLPDNVSFAVTHIKKPATDTVEVVRCKDCKHATLLYSLGKYMCKKGCGATKVGGDFCSYGAKMDGRDGDV